MIHRADDDCGTVGGNFCNWWGECGHFPIKWKLYAIPSKSSRGGLFKFDQDLHLLQVMMKTNSIS
jgi:hypothetical protein